MKNNLDFLISSKGTNISRLAKDIKVSRSTIYRVLDGGTPSAALMLKLANYFGKDVSDIFFIHDVRQIVQKKRGAS